MVEPYFVHPDKIRVHAKGPYDEGRHVHDVNLDGKHEALLQKKVKMPF